MLNQDPDFMTASVQLAIDGTGFASRFTAYCGNQLLVQFYWCVCSVELSCQDKSGDKSYATALPLCTCDLVCDFHIMTISSFLTWLVLQMFFGKPEVGIIVLENLGFGDRPRKMLDKPQIMTLEQTRVRVPRWEHKWQNTGHSKERSLVWFPRGAGFCLFSSLSYLSQPVVGP